MDTTATTSAEAINTPSRQRTRTTKGTSRQTNQRPRKVSLYLSRSALTRLDVHVAMEDGNRSRLVERLIQEGLKRYDMPRRRGGEHGPDTGEDRQDDTIS